MKLTQYSDYALRVVLYLSYKMHDKASIQEIADFYQISKDHLVKIVHHLSRAGYIKSSRGRGGGIELGCDPKTVTIGEIVREMESHFIMVECFDLETNECRVSSVCKLKTILREALDAFMAVLDRYTLDELSHDPEAAIQLIGSS
ncbi:MAG: Rrf2 family transcriptional regulator [bacterium]|nr:Rrf2 family transcriptional regulator [bacterium]